MPSTPVTRASLSPPATVGGDAFGPTSSVAVSEHGHGHHPVTQYLQGAQLLGESQCQLAGEASCIMRSCVVLVRSLWDRGESLTLELEGLPSNPDCCFIARCPARTTPPSTRPLWPPRAGARYCRAKARLASGRHRTRVRGTIYVVSVAVVLRRRNCSGRGGTTRRERRINLW